MVVVYYTSTYYLDAVLETIQSIKHKVELHLLIEIAPESMNSTIINLEKLDDFDNVQDVRNAVGEKKWKTLEKYFSGTASAKFIVYKTRKSYSFGSIKVAASLGKIVKKMNADVIHFDTISPRSIGLYPYIKKMNVFITIHDPLPHTGEGSWKKKLPQFIFFRLAKGFFFYSEFASHQFKKSFVKILAPKKVIRLMPYTYISQFLKEDRKENSILFFGRLSLYKGIDLLLKAIPIVLEVYPDTLFLIIGKASFGYELDHKIINSYSDNIKINTSYLSIEELAVQLEQSKFVVCPYRDATQSGVLMTSFAAGKMVVATNVGAFPEYIQQGINGLLTEPSPSALASTIIDALNNSKYKKIERNIANLSCERTANHNEKCILDSYYSCINSIKPEPTGFLLR